ncbi:hypothetical protein FRB96_006792 [Tulasnella sp. 330]|nr:hypothetical protein FRB96_006792 [Tulasnella sp. 330]
MTRGVANGKKTINGATLGPHELVKEALELATECEKDSHLSEASRSITKNQWNSMIERLREAGTLENYIAVCDLSGSMGTLSHSEFIQRILPAISLPSPNHHSTTRSSLPMIPKITNISSHTQTDPISTREDMVKRIFVFSDMQFDEARQVPGGRQGNKWDPNHQQIVKMFEDADYDMPEIVHWNLAGTASATGPITKNTPGVAIDSGFSSNLFKVFMEKTFWRRNGWMLWMTRGVFAKPWETATKVLTTPVDVMHKTLGKKSYGGLKVLN